MDHIVKGGKTFDTNFCSPEKCKKMDESLFCTKYAIA